MAGLQKHMAGQGQQPDSQYIACTGPCKEPADILGILIISQFLIEVLVSDKTSILDSIVQNRLGI